MIKQTANLFTRLMQRWLPDAFLIAVLLTFVVFLLGVLQQEQSPAIMVQYWGDGMWNLLSFSMQMVLILVLGHMVAQSTVVQSGLASIAKNIKTSNQAIISITVISALACWINWGFGLIVGAFLAREIANNCKLVHYPLLVAAAYSGFLVWHAGLSGSIPLKIASPGSDELGKMLDGAIPAAKTIFQPVMFSLVIALVILLVVINLLMQPNKEHVKPANLPKIKTKALIRDKDRPIAVVEESVVVNLVLALMGCVYIFQHFASGKGLGLNIINLILLVAALLLNKSPRLLLQSLQQSLSGVGGIILQFPLYAGIMGMMSHSGLAQSISQWFVEISTAETFNLFTFYSAGIVNFFVPSGGGQWAVQAPIVIPAAVELGVPLNQAAMAVAFGDAWTNMAQPFWALPLLGIAGLSIKDIMGYCTVILIASGVLISAWILLFF